MTTYADAHNHIQEFYRITSEDEIHVELADQLIITVHSKELQRLGIDHIAMKMIAFDKNIDSSLINALDTSLNKETLHKTVKAVLLKQATELPEVINMEFKPGLRTSLALEFIEKWAFMKKMSA